MCPFEQIVMRSFDDKVGLPVNLFRDNRREVEHRILGDFKIIAQIDAAHVFVFNHIFGRA